MECPAPILYESSGRNLGNESTIFHEALHGLTGKSDLLILSALYGSAHGLDPSCNISVYIEKNVLSQSSGLDQTTSKCP